MTSSPLSSDETLRTLLDRARGLILDFDGLIADSEPFHYRAYNAVFERYGHTLNQEEYWVEFTSKGKGIQGEIDRYNLKLNVRPEDMRQEKFELYAQFCENGDIPLFPQARRFLELARKHYRVAIASGSWEKDIRAILRHGQAEHLVDTILGKAPDRRPEKPAPDIFLEAAQALDLPPEQCLVVEDALKGLEAAQGAGMPCLIVLNPLNQAIDFTGANAIVSSLGDLVTCLESST